MTLETLKTPHLEGVLKPLQAIDGYLAFAVFDMKGDVLTVHNASDYQIETSGERIIQMVTGVKTAKMTEPGNFHFLQVSSESAVFCAVWAVKEQFVATILLKPKGNAGLAKVMLIKLMK
jgi:hypothetical protein